MKTIGEYVTLVTFIMTEMKLTKEKAVEKAGVPDVMKENVLMYLQGDVQLEPPTVLSDKSAVPLCKALKDDDPQPYWSAFRAFMQNGRQWDAPVLQRLRDSSTVLVTKFPQPQNAKLSAFKTRGLVVGHVQSGKTAAMAGMICRAADQGYRLVIVLAGLMNDLRAQTQRRFDQDITGTSENKEDGPFCSPEPGFPRWTRLTVSGLDGDFQPGTIQMDLNPETPKLLVVKKLPGILEKLVEWLGTSKMPLSHLPTIIVDDEADQASIDTNFHKTDENGDPVDPTKTNAAIRKLIQALPKVVYVGFTATPFANVLIDKSSDEDLYPRDFIVCLEEPAGYFGSRQLFGLGMTPTEASPDVSMPSPLDVIRTISEQDITDISNIKAGGVCPEILERALLDWALSGACRISRGLEKQHFSMLVHPSHKTSEHKAVAAALGECLAVMRKSAAMPKHFPGFQDRARRAWSDFERTSEAAGVASSSRRTFSQVLRHVATVLDEAELKVLNYGSPDAVDYRDPPKRYIVVGGNRLSRGLTLEGLSVSVFLRTSDTYDTLLQMGRWFGYRKGYHDLTRIYVEDTMRSSFADLARVELELRADLKKYSEMNPPLTPLQLAPRIRSHSALAVTSAAKMGAGRPETFSFENQTKSTVAFPNDGQQLNENLKGGKNLIKSLGEPDVGGAKKSVTVWKNVSASRIVEFLDVYNFSDRALDVNRDNLKAYIQAKNLLGELVTWDVVVPRGNRKLPVFRWTPDFSSHRVERALGPNLSTGTLLSPPDIAAWKKHCDRPAQDPKVGGLLLYMIDVSSSAPNNRKLAQTYGETMLGVTLVFPSSNNFTAVHYISQ